MGVGIKTLVMNSPTQFYYAVSYDITSTIGTVMYTRIWKVVTAGLYNNLHARYVIIINTECEHFCYMCKISSYYNNFVWLLSYLNNAEKRSRQQPGLLQQNTSLSLTLESMILNEYKLVLLFELDNDSVKGSTTSKRAFIAMFKLKYICKQICFPAIRSILATHTQTFN